VAEESLTGRGPRPTLSQSQYSGLGSAVGDLVVVGLDAVLRGQQHDTPPATRAQVIEELAQHPHRTHEVNVKGGTPALLIDLVELTLGPGHAGRLDEDVDRTEGVLHLLVQLRQRVSVSDVGREGDEPVISAVESLRSLGEFVRVEVGDGNVGSLGKEEFRGVPANTRISASDERSASVESKIHDSSSWLADGSREVLRRISKHCDGLVGASGKVPQQHTDRLAVGQVVDDLPIPSFH